MQTVVSINTELIHKVRQSVILAHYKSLEEFIESLIEEKIKEAEKRKNDPIFRMRGILKGKNGGTELFMRDKQAEIRKEYPE